MSLTSTSLSLTLLVPNDNTTVKRRICGRTVSEVVSDYDTLNVHLYTPDLFAFRVHVENQYKTLVSKTASYDTSLPDLSTWSKFCHGYLNLHMHLTNGPLYKLENYRTDSPRKLIALTVDQMQVPSWLVDICREVSRPMASDNTVFAPYPSVTEDLGDTQVVSALGIGYAQCQAVLTAFNTWCSKEGLNMTTKIVVQEDVMVAPMCVSDGEFSFVPEEVSTIRKKAWYQLQAFRNGAPVATPLTTLNVRSDEEHRVWVPRRTDLDSMLEVLTLVRDEVSQPEPNVVVPAEGQTLEAILPDVYEAILDGVAYVDAEKPKIWLYYNRTRFQQYQVWFGSQVTSGARLPKVDSRLVRIRGMLVCQDRFPTEQMRSRSPPSGPGRPQQMIRNDQILNPPEEKKRGKKSKGKPDRTVVPPPETT